MSHAIQGCGSAPRIALPGDCATAGCGDGKPWVDTCSRRRTVTGIVSVKGKPAGGGHDPVQSAAIPGGSSRSRTAQIGPDGSYTIKTYTGVNQVSFDGEVAAKNRGVGLVKEASTLSPARTKPISTCWAKEAARNRCSRSRQGRRQARDWFRNRKTGQVALSDVRPRQGNTAGQVKRGGRSPDCARPAVLFFGLAGLALASILIYTRLDFADPDRVWAEAQAALRGGRLEAAHAAVTSLSG